MRVLVAGATGAIGSPLVSRLVEAGHDVTGTTRSPAKAEAIGAAGARPAVVDALDAPALRDAVEIARPEVVICELTAIPDEIDIRHFERDFEATDRLRTEGTDNLVAAARAAGARRVVAQSFAGWPYARTGGPVKSEDDPLDPDPPKAMSRTLGAVRHLEEAVLGAEGMEGVVLRYGPFYGPGTALAEDGAMVEAVRRRRLPLIGDGGGVWSFVHTDDAARATVAAAETGSPGIYNVVDDEPAPVREWLPYLAEAIGARPPRRVPALVARIAAGSHGVIMMTDVRGASNAKARSELGWSPRYATWREGFRTGLGASGDG